MDDIVGLIAVAILIVLTAFFVASEFAIVKVRSTRLDQLELEGKKGSKAAKKVTNALDEYLSACQLGITVTALGIGWLGKSSLEGLLHPIVVSLNLGESFTTVLSIATAFFIITFLHVVIGELAPKTLAIQKAEQITLLLAPPLIWFYRIMYPLIWLLNGSARILIKSVGLKPVNEHDAAHTEEELRMIVSESFRSGEINQNEFKYVNKIFEFDDRIAKEIMIPRTEITSLDQTDSIEDFLQLVQNEKFTRYPVTDGDKDHVIGMINVKEVITDMISGERTRSESLSSFVRPIIRVIDTMPIQQLLVKMQQEQIHMAILMDEYGGTSGLVTVEDILEEIVGDIRDEFDEDEVPNVQELAPKHLLVDSKTPISEINSRLGLTISDEEMDTIGGWILAGNYEAAAGDLLEYEGYVFTIRQMEDHHIRSIDIQPIHDVQHEVTTTLDLEYTKSVSS